jgi:hypothetical protein
VEKILLQEDGDAEHPLHAEDGWCRTSVPLDIPLGESGSITYNVEGLHFCKIPEVVRAAFGADNAMDRFHFQPYEHLWFPYGKDGASVRIFDEVYTADAMLEADKALQNSPREIDPETGKKCMRERIIVPLMFASDATHLADFGQAKAWPIYLYFGNESKYDRCRPTTSSAEHIAFMPSVRFHF